MNALRKFFSYSSQKGISYAVGMGIKSLKVRLKNITNYDYRRPLLYFANHKKLSKGIYDDVKSWKDYLNIKNEYGHFINNLPHYKLESSCKTKIIWWCWLQGEDNAPTLCKVCLKSLRKQFPDYEIKIVTEENMLTLVHLPEYIVDKYRKGIISRTHFSDILRTCLLIEHGGVWIDSTVLCTGYNEPILDYPLFVFQDWKFDRQQPCVSSSWLISAWKGEPILRTVRELLFEYWRRNDSLVNYFIFHLFFHLVTEKYKGEWAQMPRFSNIPPHLLQFELFKPYSDARYKQICRGSDFHKLTYKHRLMPEGVSCSFYNKLILGE